MQGVQVAPALNDENSTRGPLLHSAFKENASGVAAAKQGSTLKTARKAFGNITNTRSDAAAQQPGGTVVKRRAFGDITNSAVKQPSDATTTAKKADPTSLLKPSSSSAAAPSGSAVASAAAAPEAVPWWETEEPERPAGKTWRQLEADREREEDEEIERSVQQMSSAFRRATVQVMEVVPYDSDEDEKVLPGPSVPFPDSPKDCAPSSSAPAVDQLQRSDPSPVLSRSSSWNSFVHLLPDIDYSWPDEDSAWQDEPSGAAEDDGGQQGAAEHTTSSISGSGHAADNLQGVLEQQEQAAQPMLLAGAGGASTGGIDSPSRPDPVSGCVPAAGLKSPEALPW